MPVDLVIHLYMAFLKLDDTISFDKCFQCAKEDDFSWNIGKGYEVSVGEYDITNFLVRFD